MKPRTRAKLATVLADITIGLAFAVLLLVLARVCV